MSQEQEFYVVIERDEDGYYVADVPELPGCHTQAKSLDALLPRVREAIKLYLEAFPQYQKLSEFVGIQRVMVVKNGS
ncbi:MAG: type II toxin-antitoxin system HicB family antitoxin [Candidatus Methanomethylicaceae archaeon]